MENGVLTLMHQGALQNDTFKQVTKGDKTYFKILDRYYPFDTPSNLRNLDESNLYKVGAIALLFNYRDSLTAYNREVLEDPIPRPHRKPIISYIRSGEASSILQFVEDAHTDSIPASDFGETVCQDVEMLDVSQKDTSFGSKSTDASQSVRDLNQDLTADKIAELANKAKQIRAQKGKSGFISSSQSKHEKILPVDLEGLSDKLEPFERFMRYKTRQHKNCTNILDTNSDFSSVLSLLAAIKSRDVAQSVLPKPPPAPVLQQQHRSQPAAGYSRYDQEVFSTNEDLFNIQTGMSFHGQSLMQKKAPEPVKTAVKRPLPYASSNSGGKPAKRVSRTPIIIIPASGTALISVYNALDILQDLRFVSTEEKKKQIAKREVEVLIQRKKEAGQTVPYRVVDNPLKLSADEWTRVVAVFVQGPAWQFKGWHWKGNPTEIFSHVCGFHLKFEDTKLDPNVAKWSVEVLQLSKTKRHLDKAIFIRLWQKIEQFIIRNKPDLRY